MLRKIKNKDIEEILNNVSHLGNYPMPGYLTLAVIEARKKLKAVYEIYNDTCKQIGESRCEKDKDGKPLSTFQLDSEGNEMIHHPKKLKFKDENTEKTALEELKILGEYKIEINIKEVNITTIENLINITPIQMEAITALFEITNDN